jgi:hypothetical protein
MLSVAVPGLVARLLDGTGRINVGQGAVMTAQGIGASLSPCSAATSPKTSDTEQLSRCSAHFRWARSPSGSHSPHCCAAPIIQLRRPRPLRTWAEIRCPANSIAAPTSGLYRGLHGVPADVVFAFELSGAQPGP